MALDGQTEIPALTPVQPSEGAYRRMLLTLSRVWAWVFLGILIVFFAASVMVTSEGSVNFLTLRNSQNILVAITPVLLMGLGQTLVIIAGGIDLSVGWVMGLASVISALIGKDLVAKGMDPAAAILLSFAGGAAACKYVCFISGT